MPLGSPAQTRMLGALAPKRHAQGPFPDGPPANNNGSNVIDLPRGGGGEPWNWMNWPKGLPTGQENNPNGFDFGLHPQAANNPTSPNAPVEQIYQDPFTNTAPKFPEGFDPMPGSGSPIEPFNVSGQFGPNDPAIAPFGPGSGIGGVPGLIMPWVQQIGDSSPPSSPMSGADISWSLGTNGAETPAGQNYMPDPGTQVDPGGYDGGAFGGMGGFGSTPDNGGSQSIGTDMGPQDWMDYFRDWSGGGGGGTNSGLIFKEN